MLVTVNKKRIEIFNGATAGDAVLAYSGPSFLRVMNSTLVIYDRFGNETDPGGALMEGADIYIKKPKRHD
ncbi:MAG: hypothetical protein M0P58_04360 [Bacteroidales bacterium]|jgi:hypothetical protein|nr:hypothetical protein [Bacteroidales bacterium]